LQSNWLSTVDSTGGQPNCKWTPVSRYRRVGHCRLGRVCKKSEPASFAVGQKDGHWIDAPQERMRFVFNKVGKVGHSPLLRTAMAPLAVCRWKPTLVAPRHTRFSPRGLRERRVRSRAVFLLHLIERLLQCRAASGPPGRVEGVIAQGRAQGDERALILRLVDGPARRLQRLPRRLQRLPRRLRHGPQSDGFLPSPLMKFADEDRQSRTTQDVR
jgi:hypothetical protein